MSFGELTDKIIFKDLSYKIVGLMYEVYNQIGYGYPEKYYQKAVASLLFFNQIVFREQVPYKVLCNGKVIGRNYLDFLIDGKIIVELKQGGHYSKIDLDQTKRYLKASGLQLAILVRFTAQGVKFLRVLNIN